MTPQSTKGNLPGGRVTGAPDPSDEHPGTIDTRGESESDAKSEEPKLPHEHDESVGSTGGVPSREMQQAHKDLERGLVDTDRGPVADKTYRQLKR